MKKHSNLIGIIGLTVLLIGLINYSINSILTTISTVLLIGGGILLLLYLFLNLDKIRTGFTSKSGKFSSNAALMIVFVLGILIVVNVLFTRFNWRMDTTAAKQFSLAPQTKSVLSGLDREVNAIAFFKSGEGRQAEQLFIEYENISPRFSYQLIDPDKEPGLAKQYKIQQYGTIVVESLGRIEKVEQPTEEALTNAMIKVTREGVKTIFFTTGHGERALDEPGGQGLATAKQSIQDENYDVDQINLTELGQDSIPRAATVLAIVGPRTDLFPIEKTKIESYLDNGGTLLMMLDPESPASYDEFLNPYGITVGDNVVIDASGIGQLFGAGPVMPIVSNYANHPITQDFSVMTFFNYARSVSKTNTVPEEYTVTELATTHQRSWGETSELGQEGKVRFDPGQDTQGPISILTVAERAATAGKPAVRLAVFGDSDFCTNGYINSQGNSDLFLNTISWLAEEEDLISVRPRDPEDRRLTLTQKQSRVILYVGVLMLPALIFVTGIVVYRKRKK